METIEANRLNQLKEYYFSTKLKEVAELNSQGQQIINLGIGNPDIKPPNEVISELNSWTLNPNTHGYQSYKGIEELRNQISIWSSEMYGIELNPSSEILPLMGSKEGITHISQAFVNPGDKVLVPNPGYPTYRAASSLTGAEIIEYDIDAKTGMSITEITKLIDSRTKIIWINFPHMPTGTRADKNTLKKLIKIAKRFGAIIVNDNPYSTILTDEYFSIFQIEGSSEVCLELNSLSKSHNMAGWRLGWISGKPELITTILKVKSNMDSGMFLPIQKAATRALTFTTEWSKSQNEVYIKRRALAWKILDELNTDYDKNTGGLFVWARIPDDIESGKIFSDKLLYGAKVFIAPGFIFGSNGDKHIRISLCSPIEQLTNALKRIQTLKATENVNKKRSLATVK